MHCPKCGIVMLDDEFTCSNCGYLTDIAIAANLVEVEETNTPIVPYYAGFWKRFLAVTLDTFFLMAGELLVLLLIYGSIALITFIGQKPLPFHMVWPFFSGFGITMFIVIHWFYFIKMESSYKQATFGKQLVRIVVTDVKEKRITMGKANLRYFSKLLSILLIFGGFVMAGLTTRKLALHDKIARTLVLNENRSDT